MSEWRHWGADMMEHFDEKLSPRNLHDSLEEYQYEFGDEFTIQDLLKIQEMRSKALIAAAINDFPEFLVDQIGLAQNDYSMPTIAKGMEAIADALGG